MREQAEALGASPEALDLIDNYEALPLRELALRVGTLLDVAAGKGLLAGTLLELQGERLGVGFMAIQNARRLASEE